MRDWTGLQRWDTVIAKLRLVQDATDEQRLLATLCSPQRATILAFVNAHAMNLVAGKADYCQALSTADVLLRDGAGMAILLRRLGQPPGLNMNGTDFIPKLLAAFNGRRVAFWGTREPFLSEAAQRCETRYGVHVVSRHEGFAGLDTYLGLAQAQQPALIVLGMGMPKQEQLAARLAALDGPCLIVCGGAILDFLGGKVTRAPSWVRRLNGEWVFRLLKEPKRLFARYVLGNPLFLLRALLYAKAPGQRAQRRS